MPTEHRVLHPTTGEPLVTLTVPEDILESYRIPLNNELQRLARFYLTASGGVAPTSLPVETVTTDAKATDTVGQTPRFLEPGS